jgi:predicted transposase YbfD/YdcC
MSSARRPPSWGSHLRQVATGDKPDEFSGFQAVLKVLDLPHSLITLDALGCQKEIVNAIAEGGGHYVIAIQANQPKLFSAVSELCEERLDQDLEELRYSIHDTVDRAYGRIDDAVVLRHQGSAPTSHCARNGPRFARWVMRRDT